MKHPQLIYIHGGEAFEDFWPGVFSAVHNYLKRPFKVPSGRWADSLPSDLTSFNVLKLHMPAKYNAKYKKWQQYFEAQFNSFDDEVVLLGWSLGANFLAKYLSENPFPKKIKALHLVAGCYGCPGGFDIQKPLNEVAAQCKDIHIYHSKDGFVVDYADAEKYAEQLPQATLHIFKDRNHFLQPAFNELIEQIEK